MDQYPYSIQQQAPAATSYPYPDGPPDKAAPPDGVVAQVPPNPYYLGAGPQVPVDHQQQQQVNFPGGFVPAEVPLPVPNGMIPPQQQQPAAPYGSYYPEQQQQQLGTMPPEQHQPGVVQYSQQDYAREANVAPVEYLPGVGSVGGGGMGAEVVQQPAVGQVEAAAVDAVAAQVFGEQSQQQLQVQQGMEQMVQAAPVAMDGGEGAARMDGDHQVQLGSEDPPQISTESSDLSTPPVEPPIESTTEPPTDAPPSSSAPDALDSTTAPPTDTTLPASTEDSTTVTSVPIVDLDDNSKDDCVITTTTSSSHHHHNKKKRRRIVQEDDSDDDDEDVERERMELLRSPELPEEGGVGNGNVDQVDQDKEKVPEEGEGERNEDEEKERSESRNSDRDDGPSILQNVVIIPVAESEAHKRKKIRVLDSDDDEDELPQMATTVDDIGLTGEGADELNPGGVEEGGEDGEFGEGLEQIVAMDAPIIDPSRMLEEGDDDEEEEQNGSDKEKEDKDGEEGSDREEAPGSDAEEPPEPAEEEVEEEEEEAEEGVEMITCEDDAGEAIGIATDDEKELDEPEEPASNQNSDQEDRGSDQDQASEAGSDAESRASRSAAGSPAENSQDSTSNQQRSEDEDAERSSEKEEESQEAGEKKAAESGDEVVCQNDLELNTISLLTDEEDDNTTPLPPPKKELPVVRIVNIKKELLDVTKVKKERYDPTSYYQQQHQIKQQQLAARKKEKKKKRERNFDNDDPFGAWSSSSTDDEFIPNDIYFGTPDRVFTASTKIRCQRQKQLNERYSAKYGKSGYKRRYSDDSDGEERRKRKQKLEQLSRLNLPSYQQAQLQTMIKKKKKKRHDRFYDKSQDIPNDIYFGNVNVPLHILYAFGDSSSEDERPNTSWRSESSSHSTHKYHRTGGGPGSRGPYKKSSSSSNYDRSSVSPSSDRSVQAMREYLKIAGFKHVKFHKLWEGCKSNQERANAILRLMQEKGLEGEPTVAKCKELRKQLQMEREAQVLDTSLIIDSGEGRITRRSKRAHASSDPSDPNAPSTSGTFVPPESAEAINRIRSLVDPDSDGE